MSLHTPLVFSKFRVKSAILQRPQPQSKPRPQLLKSNFLRVSKLVPVKPEEYIISLIMEGDATPSFKLRVEIKNCREHSANAMSQSCVEIVQDHFRSVCGLLSSAFNILAVFDAAQSEERGRTVRKMYQKQTIWVPSVLVDDYDVGETSVRGQLDHLFHAATSSEFPDTVWNYSGQFLAKSMSVCFGVV